ncbi:MAG: Arm DNA-binding domain-containing protein, partial [Flavobacteriales bacterium]
MATISVILRNDKLKKDGTAPLHFLIIKDRRKSKVTSGIFVDPKYWNADKGV